MLRRLAPGRAVAVVAALAAALWVAPVASTPETAAAAGGRCSPGTGVTILVDRLPGDGGGVEESCAPSSGGKSAKAAMAAAGVSVEEVSSGQRGFVCRIQSYPTDRSCAETPPASAYWRLYWSDGVSSKWKVSGYGYAALNVPTGGSVGWAYQEEGSGEPDTTPSVRPAPSPKPSKPAGGSGGSTKPSPSPSRPSAAPSTPAPSASAPASAAPSASADESEAGETAAAGTAAPGTKADARDDKKNGKNGKDEKGDDKDRKRASDARERDRSTEAPLVSDEGDEVVAGGEFVAPVSAESNGLSGTDAAMLAVGGLCAAGLAASAVVMARRRRL